MLGQMPISPMVLQGINNVIYIVNIIKVFKNITFKNPWYSSLANIPF